MTMYGWTVKSPFATNRGTWTPEMRGRIICSISKLTIAAGSIPSSVFGTFIRRGSSTPGRVTTLRVDMPPWWMSSPTSNPSIVVPRWMRALVIAVQRPVKRRSANIAGRPAARIFAAARSTS